jgi:ribosomal protein L17
MRILDILKRNPFKSGGPITLEEKEQDQWAQKLVAHLDLDKDFSQFQEEMQGLGEETTDSLRKFTDEGVLSAIPDRARTMNALHGNEYAQQVHKLLKSVQFTDLFSFEKQQDKFFETTSGFKDQTAKNTSVLKEFLHDELKETQSLLQKLEDRVIAFAKILEEKKFPLVRKVHELCGKLLQSGERTDKYEKLLASLQSDLKRTQDKRAKLEEDMAAQQALVRNEESLQALEKMKHIEEELHRLAVQYVSVCTDARNVYKKKPDMELAPNIKHVLDEIPKDPMLFLPPNTEKVKKAFEDIVTQFEEEQPGNVRGIIERLTRLAGSAEQDGRKISTAAPDQRALKKEIMRDIAALNMYDKRQFLMRAQSEEDAITTKITYLTAELDPNKRLTLERELKDAAKALGAQINASMVAQ